MSALVSRFRARLAEMISGETVAAVRAERAAMEARVKELSDLSVCDLNFSATDGPRIALAAEVVPHIAMLFAAHFRASGAENYVEMQLHDHVSNELFTVTLRKVIGGKTPHQLREQAERERDEARQALADTLRALGPEHEAALRHVLRFFRVSRACSADESADLAMLSRTREVADALARINAERGAA